MPNIFRIFVLVSFLALSPSLSLAQTSDSGAVCSNGHIYNSITGELCPTSLRGTVNEYNFGTTILRNGSRGEAVREVQRFLNSELGLGLVVDGVFGSRTSQAIKNWQEAQGISSDGIFGPRTIAKAKEIIQQRPGPVGTILPESLTDLDSAKRAIVPPQKSTDNAVPTNLGADVEVNTTNETEVIIRFTQKPGLAEQALVRNAGGSIQRTFNIVPAISARVPSQALAGLSRNPNIQAIEVDMKVYLHDQELDNSWGVKRIGAGTVHASGNTGKEVKIAVLDSGIDYNHPDLRSNYAGGYNFVANTNNPFDDHGHGTHVAGTIMALKDGVGVVGVAPDIRLYALKILDANGSGKTSNIIAALEWAVNNGIQITNNSYGSQTDPGSTLATAFRNAETSGILHIAAAGNSGTCAGSENNVSYPARYNSVIAVGATNENDTRPCFSSTGPTVELASPGVSINSTKISGGYAIYSGTSMATAHVSGAAVLVASSGIKDNNNNGRVNDEIRSLLQVTAYDLGPSGIDTFYGYGLVQPEKAIMAITSTETKEKEDTTKNETPTETKETETKDADKIIPIPSLKNLLPPALQNLPPPARAFRWP